MLLPRVLSVATAPLLLSYLLVVVGHRFHNWAGLLVASFLEGLLEYCKEVSNNLIYIYIIYIYNIYNLYISYIIYIHL